MSKKYEYRFVEMMGSSKQPPGVWFDDWANKNGEKGWKIIYLNVNEDDVFEVLFEREIDCDVS